MALRRPGGARQLVTGADLAMRRGRYIGMVGDLDVPSIDTLNSALAVISQAGPHTRVGLVPSTTSRRWAVDRSPLTVRPVPTDVSANGAKAVLEYIRRRPGGRSPIEVHVSDRHIAIDTDHGLGDGRLFVDLTASLLALSRGESVPWVEERDSRLALAQALFHSFGRRPSRLYQTWTAINELRQSRPVDEDLERAEVSWSPSLAVEVVHLDATLEAEVNAWRRANAPKAGSGASWMYAVFRALQRLGLPTSGRVTVAIDARRYLPPGRSVNGNFMTGIDVPVGDGDTVSSTGRRVRALTDTALPLAVMSVVSAVTSVKGLSGGVAGPTTVRRNVPAHLMYSDLGRLDMLHGGHWFPAGPCSLSGLLDPSGPDGITVLSSSIHGGRCLSITFHDNVFERQAIRRAAELLESDPVALMRDA